MAAGIDLHQRWSTRRQVLDRIVEDGLAVLDGLGQALLAREISLY